MAVETIMRVRSQPWKAGMPAEIEVFLGITYLSGSGIPIRLLWPLGSVDRTPKITLSLESGTSTLVSVVRIMLLSETPVSVVARQSTSYAVAPAAGFH